MGILSFMTALISIPSSFPKEYRPVYVCPVADVTYKNKEEAYGKLATALVSIANDHRDDRILVHTVSYDLAAFLAGVLLREFKQGRVVTYTNSGDRQRAIDTYLTQPGSILLAPSLDRGIDLPGDDCRAIVVCKVPYPSLGDKQVSARLHAPGGQLWYSVQTVRSLVQMTGRGMRSAEDFCESYILDRQFTTRIFKEHNGLLPLWWKESLHFNEKRF